MSGFFKFLGIIIIPVILGVGCALYGLNTASTSSPSLISNFFSYGLTTSWPMVFGLALALPLFLSQWVKAWVPPLIYIISSVLFVFIFESFAKENSPCFMFAGIYVLMGVSCCLGWKDKVAPAGIIALNWPVPVWIIMVLVLEGVISGLLLSGWTLLSLYLMLSGFFGGLVVSALYLTAFHLAQTPATAKTATVQKIHMSSTNNEPEQAASAPVGERPKISVLDMKMAAVVEDDPEEGSVTTAKIYVENQDG